MFVRKLLGTLPAITAILAVSCLVGVQASVSAQGRGLISQAEAKRNGMHRSWFTRIQLDSARARIVGVKQHVNAKYGFTVYKLEYDGGSLTYTEKDVDRFGDPLGKAGIEKRLALRMDQLKRAGLNPKLTKQTNPEITLYVLTDQGTVQAIDGQTGLTKWATTVGTPRYLSDGPGANDDYVAVLNGSTIYLLDQSNGGILWARRTSGAPGAGPTVTQRMVWVPMASGTIEGYEIAKYKYPPWIFQGHGRAITPAVQIGLNLAWPTDAGHLYVSEANKGVIRYRLETNNSIVARATAVPPNRIVTASTDGYVYCVHSNSGALQWRFSTGEPMVREPVAMGEAVYVVTADDSLFRVSAKDGAEQWWVPRIREVIAASQTRLYCLSDAGRLIILDMNTGGTVGTINTEVLDLRMVNHVTDRIYIGTTSGVIQCLHEVQNEWPFIHPGALELNTVKLEDEEEAKEETEEKPAAADAFGAGDPAADPFGGGGGGDDAAADPFGGGGGADAGDDAAGDDDPFGGGSDPFGGGDSPF